MTAKPRFLTKSRFTLALECPTKLFYTGKREYFDASGGNDFLAVLAEGGHQVGALAKRMHPDGIEVTEQGHEAQLARTRELLARQDVTIFEAALQARGLFVRVDVLRKRGDRVDLIEVKAKSWDPVKDGDLRAKDGKVASSFLPYLQDLAFQRHVAGLAYPQFDYRCHLMLADKSKPAQVDGLNQRFRVQRSGAQMAVTMVGVESAADLSAPILTTVAADAAVADILDGTLSVDGQCLPFAQAVDRLADAWREDVRIDPRPSAACASCQFRTPAPPAGDAARSGFHECWKAAFGWTDADFAGGTILDLAGFRRKNESIAQGVVRLRQVTLEDLGFDGSEPDVGGMTNAQRQWYQCHGGWPGGGDWYFDRDGFEAAAANWKFPLHFIDFETSAVAIPFHRGARPYETIAFQFSHHRMHADGRVEHATQFLDAAPGGDPSAAFLRALRTALSQDDGTVLHWASHEQTVLRQLARRLGALDVPPPDIEELTAFVSSLAPHAETAPGVRPPRMVDLCRLAKSFYFHPQTRGSSSLKKVLPALMSSSPHLRELYGQAVYGTSRMPSLNLREPVAWWVQRDGQVLDPYSLLPPVHADLAQDGLDAGELDERLKDGGAAMAAYARLQSEDLAPGTRAAIEAALLRYCELDTLAMVMAVQAWQAELRECMAVS